MGLVASSAIALSAGSAQALSITAQANTPFSTVEGARTITFDNAVIGSLDGAGYTHESGVSYRGIGGNIVTDSVGGKYAAPPSQGDYDNANNPYLTVGSYNTQELVIDFGVESDYFGFYFGSIDDYNNLFFYNGDELIASLTGKDIRENANGDQSVNGARFVNIFAEEGENFDKIIFQSNKKAFETDNHAYRLANPEAVPTPAAVLPILSGLFAVAKRRKQDDTAE
ncbi:hypothetical protein NIES208_05975 [[Limnothrix rosea] IAM M-220]|nr:hypothetical protein NIES208_05975 [[Limnothrix rosea] IAM M-220]